MLRIDWLQVQLDIGMLGRHLQAIPMCQLGILNPAFSQEAYHPPPLSAPEATKSGACTTSEPAEPSERDTSQAAATASQAVEANVAAPSTTTSAQSRPSPAQAAPVVPEETIQLAVSEGPAVLKGSLVPPASAAAASERVVSDMDKDLDDLLAASSPARRPSKQQQGQTRKPTAPGSSVVAPQSSRVSRPAAKGNARNAKAALEDWLDL